MAVITDEHVGARYLDALTRSLAAEGILVFPLTLPAGEKTKSFDPLIRCCNHILEAKIERNDAVIALGGGVIGDLTGFAAGIVRRGTRFIQIPTSLLAQADFLLGGKRINSRHGEPYRRLPPAGPGAGRHRCPRYAEPPRIRAGYAEVAKYGLIDKPDFFEWLETNWRDVFAAGGPARIQAIATSCQAKADVVAQDEREAGLRALLNLGHTFGHALEAATEYDSARLVHGEGVSIGIVLAHQFGADEFPPAPMWRSAWRNTSARSACR